MRAIVLGNTTYDKVIRGDDLISENVGGSQLNTAISVARLGIPTTFVSTVGRDKVGDTSLTFLTDNEINTDHVVRHAGTSRIAIAHLDDHNNANYEFISASDTCAQTHPSICEGDYILFGSSYATKSEGRDKLVAFLMKAREQGATLIYDPNFRKSNKPDDIKPLVDENMKLAHMIKGSDEDFEAIYNVKHAEDAWTKAKEFGCAALFYTAGADCAHSYCGDKHASITIPKITPVSTIGAGDAFSAGIIYSMYKSELGAESLSSLSTDFLHNTIDNAVTFAQQVCMSSENYLSMDFAREFCD